MKKLFFAGLDFLLFSNVFIALCAVAQALVTYRLLNSPPDKYVLALLFASTLAMYNSSVLMSRPAFPEKSPFRRVRWVFSHYHFTVIVSIITGLLIIPLALFLSPASQILLFFLGLISAAYNLPVFGEAEKKFGLRNVPGIKLFLIASVWALSCVLLPILELESCHITAVPTRDTVLLVAKRFLFIAAITIPFDIRDVFQDNSNQLKTIPVILGERKAYLVCMLFLIGYLLLLFLFRSGTGADFIGLTLTVVLTSWLIFRSRGERDEYYYFFFLDGTMIVQYLVLLACSFISL